jgi:RimJ/RimL family protein N-acetyltransferase
MTELPEFLRIAGERDVKVIAEWMLSDSYSEFCEFTPILCYSHRLEQSISSGMLAGNLYFVAQNTSALERKNLGFVALTNIDLIAGSAEYSVFLPNCSDSISAARIKRKALRAGLEYGFECLKLKRITAEVIESNVPVRAFLERSGFRVEGRSRGKIYRAGCDRDTIHYALSFRQWCVETSPILSGKKKPYRVQKSLLGIPHRGNLGARSKQTKIRPVLEESFVRLANLVDKSLEFRSRWQIDLSRTSAVDGDQRPAVKQLLSNSRRIFSWIGMRDQVSRILMMVSLQGFPHSFAKLDFCIEEGAELCWLTILQEVECLLCVRFNLQSLQIPVMSSAIELREVLIKLGWTLDFSPTSPPDCASVEWFGKRIEDSEAARD